MNSISAVAYVRMSTEHQQYSTDNESDVIRAYAEKRSFHILRTYSDEGKSGLKIQGRDSLGRLLGEIETGNADFKAILVYDISRWGRFQDADESAYYEYICKRAGVTVHYCAEQFENDGSPVSTIVKGVKRAMAGEYSVSSPQRFFKGLPASADGLQTGRTGGLWAEAHVGRPVGRKERALGNWATQKHPNRSSYSGARAAGGGENRAMDVFRFHQGRMERASYRYRIKQPPHPHQLGENMDPGNSS